LNFPQSATPATWFGFRAMHRGCLLIWKLPFRPLYLKTPTRSVP
jgi:hypothetical protein